MHIKAKIITEKNCQKSPIYFEKLIRRYVESWV